MKLAREYIPQRFHVNLAACFLLTDSYQMYSDDDRNHSGKEALDWFVRMQSDSVTEAERAAFIAWRDAKPENAQAYADTELLSHKLAALKGHSAYHIPGSLPIRSLRS